MIIFVLALKKMEKIFSKVVTAGILIIIDVCLGSKINDMPRACD